MRQVYLMFPALVMLGSAAAASTRTWTGGGSDPNFSTANNWGGVTLANGDALVFSGATAASPNNDLTDFSAAGLTFNNTKAFSLFGNPITLTGNVTNAALTSAITDTIANDLVLGAATNTFSCLAYHSLTVNGVISGSGALAVSLINNNNNGILTLNGLNTYTGPTLISAYQVNINTIANIGDACSLGAPTTAEDATITLAAGRLSYKGSTDAATDRPIKVTVGNSTAQIYCASKKTLTLNGTIYGDNGTQSVTFREAGNVVVNGLITNMNDVGRTDAGTLYLTNGVNYFKGTFKCSTGTIFFNTISNAGVACSIGTGNNIQLGQNSITPPGVIVFTGPAGGSSDRKITLWSNPGDTSASFTGGGIISNAVAGQTLTLTGDISVSYAGHYPPLVLTGPGDGVLAKAIPNPVRVFKQDSGTWTLAGANTTTGAVSITGGALLVNGSTAAQCGLTASTAGTLGGTGTVSGAVSILNGGTLAPGLTNQVGTLALGSDLTLDTGAVFAPKFAASKSNDEVTVAGNLNLVGNAVLNPALLGISTLPVGTYTLMTYAAKTGSGTLTLPAEFPGGTVTLGATSLILTVAGTLTWSGDGTANRWDLSAANWGGSLYSDGDAVLFDDTGSDTPPVSIGSAVNPLSVTVKADTKAYTFTGAGIAGAASLTKSGAAPFVISNANTYTGPTVLTGGTNTLAGSLSGSSIMINADTVFNETDSGAIAGESAGLTVLGTASLAGTNTYGGPTVLGDYVATSKASLTVQSPEAIGNTSGISVRGYSSDGKAEVDLCLGGSGQTYSNKTVTFSGIPNARVGIFSTSQQATTWAGDIVLDSSGGNCNVYIQNINSPYELILGSPTGGNVITGECASIAFRGDTPVICLYSRVLIGNSTFTRDNRGTLHIYSTSNEWSYFNFSQGYTILEADNALATNRDVSIGKASSDTTGETILDLNGHSQLIGRLSIQKGSSATPGNNVRTIRSVAPATLTINSSNDASFGDAYSSITGAVSIVKQGTGTQTLASTNSMTGFIRVSGGTLAATSGRALGAATNVTVEAGATLSLAASDAFGGEATLAINSGTVSLGAGVKETVAYLEINGESKGSGTYGGSGSGADHVFGCFSGTGIVTVSKGSGGSRVILR